MTAWLIAIALVYGIAFLCLAGSHSSRKLRRIYDEGVRDGKKYERDTVLERITRQTWIFRREHYGMFAYCKLSSDIGEIPLPGPMDFEDGEIVLIQRRLPHHPRCPFFFLGYEADLSVTMYRPIPRDIDEYDDS